MVVALDNDKNASTNYLPKSAILGRQIASIITLSLEYEVGAKFGYFIYRSCGQKSAKSLSRAQDA